MKSSFFIFKEHLSNVYLIKRLAEFQIKISNKNNYLGVLWEVLNPFIQIMMYWFIFGLGFRSNRMIEGTPFIFWLIVGISMWFFINQGILQGTKAITSKYNQVSKMNFSLSILPSYLVVSKFYSHIVLLIIVNIICWIGGYAPSIYTFQLFLFIPYTLFLTMAIALLTSTLGAIIRDTQMIIQAGMRMIFFMSSILYLPANQVVLNVIKLNPVYFIAQGYRSAILHHTWFFINHWKLAVYNILFLIVIYIIGSILHVKYRDRFADYI
ncbi:ABC transporter permease [Staphylococcus warneri]|uniref:ABC transporter permease n=1 Tax=Staphylococcus warneri TaxID=1292 RepID=UPI002004C22F|nr:ABC transporter permease [Staphylococcus warneri]MCK6089556.1 ABC transporter permease [Staphylococcus warneri]MCK6245362.1 ABC transporter permease [Staphylococcus warneri]